MIADNKGTCPYFRRECVEIDCKTCDKHNIPAPLNKKTYCPFMEKSCANRNCASCDLRDLPAPDDDIDVIESENNDYKPGEGFKNFIKLSTDTPEKKKGFIKGCIIFFGTAIVLFGGTFALIAWSYSSQI